MAQVGVLLAVFFVITGAQAIFQNRKGNYP